MTFSSSSAVPAASSPQPAVVVPAQLGFLAIFNPSLGTTDETLDDQIVYYASVNSQQQHGRARQRRRAGASKPTEGLSQEERNERLRQIGLAQGMVEFGRGFADGQPVDVIETEKARVVLRELEPGWWILASIDLTKLPLPPRLGSSSKDDTSENVEYSSREVKPATLLLQDLLRAHSTFLLHHAASLSALFVRSERAKFSAILGRYWDLFLSTWNVMLHGNPACALFGGVKIAACGELGIGVGEEDRGSGERAILEGFVGRFEGLVDLVVSKFGEAEFDEEENTNPSQTPKWLGTGEEPGAEDGAIFLGVGALSRHSLRDLTCWMEDLYTWGEDAYGVRDSPTSVRAKVKRRRPKSASHKTGQVKSSPENYKDVDDNQTKNPSSLSTETSTTDRGGTADDGGTNKLMNYLKLGYGTHWSLGGSETAAETAPFNKQALPERPKMESRKTSRQAASDGSGHYLIGLRGEFEDSDDQGFDNDADELESRTLLRTIRVELEKEARDLPEDEKTRDLGSGYHELKVTKSGRRDNLVATSTFDSQDRNKSIKMRVVVYVNKPFIFTFLFNNRTDSLAYDSLYKSLHQDLARIQRSLSLSTSYRPDRPDSGATTSHIFDLIWDPRSLLVHSTIPSIPDPYFLAQLKSKQQNTWSRLEALSTHTQILQTYAGTREDISELERTSKTSRGWWVVWTRILEAKETKPQIASQEPDALDAPAAPPALPTEDSQDSNMSNSTTDTDGSIVPNPSLPSSSDGNVSRSEMSVPISGATTKPVEREEMPRKAKVAKIDKEIFLIRKAGESASRGRSLSQISEGKEGWTDGASRLAQGIGVDTRKYIEGLLSLAQ